MSAFDARRCLSELMPEHTIFLSHSGQEKSFVEQLCEDLKCVNHSPFFDYCAVKGVFDFQMAHVGVECLREV
jgi:hypothetical protein